MVRPPQDRAHQLLRRGLAQLAQHQSLLQADVYQLGHLLVQETHQRLEPAPHF